MVDQDPRNAPETQIIIIYDYLYGEEMVTLQVELTRWAMFSKQNERIH